MEGSWGHSGFSEFQKSGVTSWRGQMCGSNKNILFFPLVNEGKFPVAGGKAVIFVGPTLTLVSPLGLTLVSRGS